MTTKVIWKEVRKTPDINALLPYAHTHGCTHPNEYTKHTRTHVHKHTHRNLLILKQGIKMGIKMAVQRRACAMSLTDYTELYT